MNFSLEKKNVLLLISGIIKNLAGNLFWIEMGLCNHKRVDVYCQKQDNCQNTLAFNCVASESHLTIFLPKISQTFLISFKWTSTNTESSWGSDVGVPLWQHSWPWLKGFIATLTWQSGIQRGFFFKYLSAIPLQVNMLLKFLFDSERVVILFNCCLKVLMQSRNGWLAGSRGWWTAVCFSNLFTCPYSFLFSTKYTKKNCHSAKCLHAGRDSSDYGINFRVQGWHESKQLQEWRMMSRM